MIKPLRKTSFNPVWKGPEVDGITQSLLSRWMNDRERFRLMTVAGLVPTEEFNSPAEYGHMFHKCQEFPNDWEAKLKSYCNELGRRYPLNLMDIGKWHRVCSVQYPIYSKYWRTHPLEKAYKPIYNELVFGGEDLPVHYRLKNGRTVLLRGKIDQLLGKQKQVFVYDDKTKSSFDVARLCKDLPFNHQMMFYVVATRQLLRQQLLPKLKGFDLAGIRYNLVRRPLSGGKYNISQHKGRKTKTKGIVGAESVNEYWARLGKCIAEDTSYFFQRIEVTLIPQDVDEYEERVLDPLLTQLVDWWDYVVKHEGKPPWGPLHWMTPFGVYNSFRDSEFDDYSDYLLTGDDQRLTTVKNLYEEL